MGIVKKLLLLLSVSFMIGMIPDWVIAQGVHFRDLQVEPNLSNYNSRIIIEVQPRSNLSAENDFITVAFDPVFHVPETIHPQHIMIGNLHPLAVYISGKSISLRLPEDLRNGGQGRRTITIHQSAGIYNPEVAGSYPINITTSQSDELVTNSIQIVNSGSTVHSVMLNPLPPTAGKNVDMYINFMTGDGGLLEKGRFIHVEFDEIYNLTPGLVTGVFVNELQAKAEVLSSNQLKIEVPFTARYSTCMTIRVEQSAGFENPPAGTYQIYASTDAEPGKIVSLSYVIHQTGVMSAPSVEIFPDQANSVTDMNIYFYSGYHGVMQANQDYYELVFPDRMRIPASINNKNVQISYQGFKTTPAEVTVVNDSIIRIVPSQNIDEGKMVEIRFLSEVGIRNPNLWGGYKIAMTPKRQDGTELTGQLRSNNFYVGKARTTVTPPRVWFDINNQGGSYDNEMTINFKTGNYGYMMGGLGEIILDLPIRADLRNYDYISLNGVELSHSNYDIDFVENLITLLLPESMDINSGGDISVKIGYVGYLRDSEEYQLYARTSVEIRPVASELFYGPDAYSSTVDVRQVELSEFRVNRSFGMDISFTNMEIRRQAHLLFLRLPDGVMLPANIISNHIQLYKNGAEISGEYIIDVAVERESSLIMIEISPDLDAGNQDLLRIVLSDMAGIRHSSVPNESLNLEISSSEHRFPYLHNYALVSNEVAPGLQSVTAFPNHAGEHAVAYQIDFETGVFGRLLGGNTITIEFPQEVILPSNISSSGVLINEVQAQNVQKISGNKLLITVDQTLSISQQAPVRILLNSTIGISTASDLNYLDGVIELPVKLHTNAESVADQTNVLLREFATYTFYHFESSSKFINSPASYSMEVQVGNEMSLNNGTMMYVEFPDSYHVPPTILNQNILINGSYPENVTVNDYTIVFPLTESIYGSGIIQIVVSEDAGLINAANDNPHTIRFSADGELWIESPVVTLQKYDSQISRLLVIPDTTRPGIISDYAIYFQTGTHGRLVDGVSFIHIDFPDDTGLEYIGAVTVNDMHTEYLLSEGIVKVLVPEGLQVHNLTNVTIRIENVMNPSVEYEAYVTKVRTCAELLWASSTPYPITIAGPVTILNSSLFTLTNPVVNKRLQFEFSFTVEIDLIANQDDISLYLPFISQLPNIYELQESIDSLIILIIDGEQYPITQLISVDKELNGLTFKVPATITASTGAVTLRFNGSDDFLNPSEPGDGYAIALRTNRQLYPYIIYNVEVYPSMETHISDLMVTLQQYPDQQYIESMMRFRTGDLGALHAGRGTIRIQTPAFYRMPSIIDPSAVMVNNFRAHSVDVEGQTMILTVPRSAKIGNSEFVQITISRAAQIYIDNNINAVVNNSGNDNIMDQILSENSFYASTSPEPEFTSAGETETLPVEMTDFRLVSASGSLNIEWVTATEQNNYGFFIDRVFETSSSDEAPQSGWKEIAFVEGAGESRKSRTYSFKDTELTTSGTYWYRIRQMDYDGTEEVFGALSYYHSGPEFYTLRKNYPNPFNPVTTIPFEIASEGLVHMSVYNILGQRVRILVDEAYNPGIYQAVFDARELSSGVYIVRMVAGGQQFTQKIMLVK